MDDPVNVTTNTPLQRVLDMMATDMQHRDRRIAELEAQITAHPAALAAAKREALEEAIKFCVDTAEANRKASHRVPMYGRDESQSIFRELAQEDEVIAGELRRMAAEAKP